MDAVLAPFPESVEIEFEITMELKDWQRLTIIGNTDELGHWRDAKRAIMEREGNVWKLKRHMRQQVFRYKYAIVHEQGHGLRPEEGQERICDIQALTCGKLKDTWETVDVRFIIYHPLKDTEIMRIQGDGL